MPIPQKVIPAFLGPPLHLCSGNRDPAIGEAFLFADLLVRPTCRIKLRRDVTATIVLEEALEFRRKKAIDNTPEQRATGVTL
jgi:hypothetical protein